MASCSNDEFTPDETIVAHPVPVVLKERRRYAAAVVVASVCRARINALRLPFVHLGIVQPVSRCGEACYCAEE